MATASDDAFNPVLSSAEWIATRAKDVTVIERGAKEAALKVNFKQVDHDDHRHQILEAMGKGAYGFAQWKKHPLNPKELNVHTLHWQAGFFIVIIEVFFFIRILVVDTLNFSFWSSSDTLFTVRYNGVNYTGYWSLCAAINRALEVRLVLW